jgi:hypothetical protein
VINIGDISLNVQFDQQMESPFSIGKVFGLNDTDLQAIQSVIFILNELLS